MRIKKYRFGNIYQDNKHYKNDLIIYPDRIDSEWWRKESHRLYLEDIESGLTEKPEILIIGTGFYGLMKVDQGLIEYLENAVIEYYLDKTGKAVKKYNEISESKKVITALHLTC